MDAVKEYLVKETFVQAKVSTAYQLFEALSQLTRGNRCDANAIKNDLASGRRAISDLDTKRVSQASQDSLASSCNIVH